MEDIKKITESEAENVAGGASTEYGTGAVKGIGF